MSRYSNWVLRSLRAGQRGTVVRAHHRPSGPTVPRIRTPPSLASSTPVAFKPMYGARMNEISDGARSRSGWLSLSSTLVSMIERTLRTTSSAVSVARRERSLPGLLSLGTCSSSILARETHCVSATSQYWGLGDRCLRKQDTSPNRLVIEERQKRQNPGVNPVNPVILAVSRIVNHRANVARPSSNAAI